MALLVRLSSLAAVAVSIVSCGGAEFLADGAPIGPPDDASSASVGFGSGVTVPHGHSNGGTAAKNDGAPAPDDGPDGAADGINDAAPSPLTVADSAPEGSMSDCIPGTYTGSFSTTVGVADGGFPSTLFGVPWNGTLSIALLTSGTMLTVAPGARISGADQMGGTFAADVSGQLDCVSRVFVGALSNGVYSFFGDAATTTLTGTLSATYDSTSNPVALVGGSLDFRSPQVPGVEAAGTWSATRR